jgi:predicted exporter
VFSAAGLVGAYLSAVCLLPALLKGVELRPAQWPLRIAEGLWRCAPAGKRVPSAVLLVWCCCSAPRPVAAEQQNDIRQWVGAPPQLLQEAQAVARITGSSPPASSSWCARQSAAVARTPSRLSQRLEQLVEAGQAPGLPGAQPAGQPAGRATTAARGLEPTAGALAAAAGPGCAASALHAEVAQLQALPTEDIDAALAGPLAEPWRTCGWARSTAAWRPWSACKA